MSGRSTWTAEGRPLLEGSADGVALVLDQPLSFWGGLDQGSGTIIDTHHPQHGRNVRGRALVMPSGRGSSSSSSVLAEAIRAGNGPSVIVLREPDEIVVLGALVAQLMDGSTVPVIVAEADDYDRLRDGDLLSVHPNGALVATPTQAPER